jgi:hypothetical protein
MRRWRESEAGRASRARQAQRLKKKYHANLEESRRKHREYRLKNLERIRERDRNRTRDHRPYLREWYKKNGERQRAKVNEYRLQNLMRIREKQNANLRLLDSVKAQLGCAHCQERDIDCLEFHHTDPRTKTRELAQLCKHSRKRLLEELNKCVVLCANCHCKEHRKPRQQTRLRPHLVRKQGLIDKALSAGCSDCGEKDPICLEFHHRRGTVRRATVPGLRNYRIEILLAEIKKCDVLCANCHAKRHSRSRRLPRGLRKKSRQLQFAFADPG